MGDTDATLELACELIRRSSVTPEDAGCQALMAERLRKAGFEIEFLAFGEVSNLWARRGSSAPLFVFAGHTDVVPPGPLEDWQSPPFEPEIRDGYLYGRGAADMKGSLAAMVTAVEAFVSQHPDHAGSIAFLITSDEEGPAVHGTRQVMETLTERGEKIDLCVVGEPSSAEHLGDTIKNGRRGSLGALLRVHGRQGHVAYPHLADNPLHRLTPALAELCAIQWDEGDEHFPPTSFQITNLHSGTGADNVIPGHAEVMFNLRYSPALNADLIREKVTAVLESHQLQYELQWRHSGEPFITPPGKLVDAMQSAVQECTGVTPCLSTAGGTSDGRFIAPTGAEVAELGPVNATIHKVNESVRVDDLEALSRVYRNILKHLLV